MSTQNIADNFTDHFRSTLGLPGYGCIRTEPKLPDFQSIGLVLTAVEKTTAWQMIQYSSEVMLVTVVNQSLLNLWIKHCSMPFIVPVISQGQYHIAYVVVKMPRCTDRGYKWKELGKTVEDRSTADISSQRYDSMG